MREEDEGLGSSLGKGGEKRSREDGCRDKQKDELEGRSD